MKAAWYEKQGPAADVLIVGDMPDPVPVPGEVRIHISASGINPGDTKKRADWAGFGMSYPRVIPHSDGAGKIDKLGDGVPPEWLGRGVWCWGAQSYRAFGTAAEFVTLPLDHVAPLPKNVSPEQGACLGIPGITAHRAVHVAGDVNGRTVLIQGAAGAVGQAAVALARLAGARVIGTVRALNDEAAAKKSGAHEIVLSNKELVPQVKALAPAGIDHIVEVAFAANIDADLELLKPGGSISTYATNDANAKLPFWQLCFKNVRLFFLGSDDFPIDAKLQATKDLNRTLESGWPGFEIAELLPLSEIARAHDLVDHPTHPGRIILTI